MGCTICLSLAVSASPRTVIVLPSALAASSPDFSAASHFREMKRDPHSPLTLSTAAFWLSESFPQVLGLIVRKKMPA